MKKKGLTFYVVGILTILSTGFCILTLKQSLVGASYTEEPTPTYFAAETQPENLPYTSAISTDPEESSSTSAASSSVSAIVSAASTPAPSPSASPVYHPTYPARLIIPSVSIDAFVQQTGLTKTGAMGIPTNFTDVAWYRDSAIPGEAGNTVIDGHVDNALALAGVFKHLGEIKIGDDIFVKNKKGEEIHYVVSSLETYDYDKVPTAEIFGSAALPTLRLITCGGTWVKAQKTYDRRIVVTATLAS